MNGQEAQLRFNFLEYWKSHYYGYDTDMNGREFFEWCIRKDIIDDFIAIYYDWVMSDFSDDEKPMLSGRGENMKWVGKT